MSVPQAESAQIVSLNLSQKSLTNLSVSCLSGCEFIQILNVSANKLTKLFESETKLPNLIELNAVNNIISQLQYLPCSLLVLNLSHNSICQLSNLLFVLCHQLKDIDLSHNRLAHDLNALTKAPALQQLNLSCNRIEKESAVTQLAGCRQLRKLNIAGNLVSQGKSIECKRILRNALPHLEDLIIKANSNQNLEKDSKEKASNKSQDQILPRDRSSTKTRSPLSSSPINRKASNPKRICSFMGTAKDSKLTTSEKKVNIHTNLFLQEKPSIESGDICACQDDSTVSDYQPSFSQLKLEVTPQRKKWNIRQNNSSNKRNNHNQTGKNNRIDLYSWKQPQIQSKTTFLDKTNILNYPNSGNILKESNLSSFETKPIVLQGYPTQSLSTNCKYPIREFDTKPSAKLELKIGRLEETQAMKEVLIKQQHMMIESLSQELGEGRGFTSIFEKNMYLIYQQSKCDILLIAISLLGDYSDVSMENFIAQLDAFSHCPDPIKLSLKKPLADQLIEALMSQDKEEQCCE